MDRAEAERRIVYNCKRDSTAPGMAKRYGLSLNTVWGILTKHGVTPKKKAWSRRHDRCAGCGTTRRRHHSHGMCANCHQKWLLLSRPASMARKKARNKAWRAANPERQAAYRDKWQAAHPDRRAATALRLNRLYRASGYDGAFIIGTPVNVAWANDYEGAPRVLRVVWRYAFEREAFVDLRDEDKVYAQVPMSSLTLVVEKGTKGLVQSWNKGR